MSPMYSHYCQGCKGETEHSCKVDDRKQFVVCEHCGGSAERVISAQIQRVEPTWLDDAKRQLQPDSRDMIRDRNDLQKHMEKENIAQIG